jgi:site-specific recombinase XerD
MAPAMRLLECLRLRVKDIEFERRELIVLEGKGNKDRVMGALLCGAPSWARQGLAARLFVERSSALQYRGSLPGALRRSSGAL